MDKEIKLCFVCTGNTCRSIMAERLLKKVMKDRKIKGLKVSSRGINALGDNISSQAKIILKRFGASDKDRKSIKLRKTDKNTLYVAMTDNIKRQIEGRAISMKDLLGYDITDPYGQGLEVYNETAVQLLEGIDVLLTKILNVRSK